MQKTVFKIAKMDCPSEEQMIRMKLADLTHIHALDFDITNRQLTVFHSGSHDQIFKQLDSLNYNTRLIESVSADNYKPTGDNTRQQQKILWQVLIINFFLFVLECIMGFISNSMGLVADGLDMLADSLVYGLALFAVGGTITRKRKITAAAGYFQLILALFGFIEVIRRFLGLETIPTFQTMILVSLLALAGNAACLWLLQKNKSTESHMQASVIFTSNDIIVNLGVIIAGVLVYITHSNYPDLIIGSVVFFIVGRGAIKILQLSKG